MRFFILALSLIITCLSTTGSLGFEIEDQRNYPGNSNAQTLRIVSTTDIAAFEPLILSYQQRYPARSVDYTVASSADVQALVQGGEHEFDLVISSAMDLQTKLANDGFAQSYSSSLTANLPDGAKWRDQLFAFTQEPATLVISKAVFEDMKLPTNRNELIELLRANADQFLGKVGTYDARISGLGYLFATQDSRNTDTFWRLTEVMGRLNAELYCCSGSMIDDVASGKLAMAYNVLGSYAATRALSEPGIEILSLQDYSTIMMRVAFISKHARSYDAAGEFIDFLIAPETQKTLLEKTGLPPILEDASLKPEQGRPIRLGPGLLVFLDKLKKEAFLRNWENAILQK